MEKSNKICSIVEIILSSISFAFFLFCLIFSTFFNAFQFLLMSICIILPLLITKLFKYELKNIVIIIYQLFIIAHFLFGEVIGFYVFVSNYDTMLHLLSSFFICIFAYDLFNIDNKKLKILIAVLFALTCEYIWEIIEFCIDHFFNTNMQRFIKNNIVLCGHMALLDTTKDMMIAICGCFMFVLFVTKRKIPKRDL